MPTDRPPVRVPDRWFRTRAKVDRNAPCEGCGRRPRKGEPILYMRTGDGASRLRCDECADAVHAWGDARALQAPEPPEPEPEGPSLAQQLREAEEAEREALLALDASLSQLDELAARVAHQRAALGLARRRRDQLRTVLGDA